MLRLLLQQAAAALVALALAAALATPTLRAALATSSLVPAAAAAAALCAARLLLPLQWAGAVRRLVRPGARLLPDWRLHPRLPGDGVRRLPLLRASSELPHPAAAVAAAAARVRPRLP